jgi:hypothetical protein
MMGSDGSEALCRVGVCQVYFPRPTGNHPSQDSDEGNRLGWRQPRLGYTGSGDGEGNGHQRPSDCSLVPFAGGDRLLDGTYQDDWKAVEEAKRAFGRA